MKNLRQIRMDNNQSQEDLAYELGMNQSTIHDCELGKRGKKVIALLVKLADYYDVSVDYLLGRTSIKNALTKEEYQIAHKISRLRDPEVAEHFWALLAKFEELDAQADEKKS